MVADRGMVSQATLKAAIRLSERSTAKDPAPLKIKEVWVEDRRYVVCLNEERRKDAYNREGRWVFLISGKSINLRKKFKPENL